MIKRFLAICLLMLSFIGLKAQQHGNEWINYSQNYFKIKIAQNGIYRIDSTVLSNALASSGISLTSINPQNFQIFNKGQEQPIFVQGESDGLFDGSDFIEFYGEKNDGSLDSLLYFNTSFVPNPYYSLVNDTAIYFLTWNSSLGSRMIPSTDTAFSSFGSSPESYFMNETILDLNDSYFAGETFASGTDARYTKAEGWFDGNVISLGPGGIRTYSIFTPNIYFSAPSPFAKIKMVAVGASKDNLMLATSPFVDHHLNIKYNGFVFKDTAFKGYEANRFIDSVPLSNLVSAGSNSFQFTSLVDPGFTSNRTALSYININYPHTFDLEAKNNFVLQILDNIPAGKSLLDISNFTASGTVRLYDLKNARRIDVVQFGANYKALVPNGGLKKCYITSDGFINTITSLFPVSPSAKFNDYLNIPNTSYRSDSSYLIITNKSLMPSASQYAAYRSSMNGGSYNVVLADIDELYDQFAYGIVKSPLSIRGFVSYLISNNPSAPPQNLFLMGKSIHLADCRHDATNYDADFVPSWGNPSCDNLITAGLNGTVFAPGVPTGRLAARTNTDIDWYLEKIQDYESNQPDEWMKQVLHFGGGNDATEQTQLKNYLNAYKTTIEDTLYGGHVKSFFKTSTAPIEINSSDTLRQLINNGVSLMTFFGHASGTGFDQSIDDWSTYSPILGHYPFLLANSCYAGDLHNIGMSSSESFTFLHNNGVIGYVGSVGLGIPYALNTFSSEFYNQLALTSYGKSVGVCIKKAIINDESLALMDNLVLSACFEMTLHGDPALKLNTHSKPDYKITSSDLYFNLTTPIDSFTVYAIRTNIGKAIRDTIIDEIIRIKPNGDSISYYFQSVAPKFKDTIFFKIPIDAANNGVGLNKVIVNLDRFAHVDELSETNNSTGEVNVFITGGDIVPVYPYDFAIIPKDSCTLRASTTNPFATSRSYIIQIDTTDTYNSPLKMQKIITAPGGVISWNPKLDGFPSYTNKTVYYWRVSADSIDTTGYHWRESSFQYIVNKRGWEQAHFFQFKNDGYQYTKFNRPARRYDFVNDITTIHCSNGVPPFIAYYDVLYKRNNSVLEVSSWLLPGMTLAVFSPNGGVPWRNKALGGGRGQHGSSTGYLPGTHFDEYAFDFLENNAVERDTIRQFIDSVPTGSYVLAYSQEYSPWGLHNVPSYETSLLNAFDSIGGTLLHSTIAGGAYPANAPFIIFGKKGGAPGSAQEIIGDSMQSAIQMDANIVSNWTDGFIASPVIGPATSWDSLSWAQHTLDPGISQDSIWIKVIGIRSDGTEDTLATFNTSTMDVPNLSSYANATIYPKMRLVAYMKDDSLHTPPQLDRWQVIYTPVPEAAVNPPLGYAFTNSTLQEGDNIKIELPIQNISEYPFTDSLLFTYWIEDANRINHPLPSKLKNPPFNPGSVIIDTISTSTAGFPGANALWVEVNSIGQSNTQLEQYHFNNIARIPFTVTSDHVNPLLDVTFDGVHILNNDIVSAKPNVLIQLKDENQFLALNDTNDFKVFVKAPSSSTAVRVYFGSYMTFIPAVLPNNSCRLNYTPVLYEDGTYQLIVQAKDVSDNQSGAIDYKIGFEVINRSTITEVMNYPNPFSTSTRFVFTLTGSEIPNIFKIQIMTISGKVVKEIFANELGALHVGRNITDYAWDGKDEFGDQLANGIYLYHVITRINGEDIERKETAADQYFKKGWGKMFLMR